jgi:hypothetical protein
MNATRTTRASATAAATVAAVLTTLAVTAAPAQAHPHEPYGTVVSHTGLNERQYPSTDSHIVGSLGHGAQVGLKCKVRAQYINGNTIWYLLRHKQAWVTARYVANHGYVPYCKNV